MESPPAARQGVAALFALLLVGALCWALVRFGATQTPVLYALFLGLAAIGAGAALVLPARPFERRGGAALLALAALLVVQVARLPTLEARGYVHWAIGCLALTLAIATASHGEWLQKGLYGLLVAVGASEAGFGLLEVTGRIEPLARHPEIQRELAIGTLINPNHFAGLLAMSACLSIGGLAWSRLAARRARRWPWLAVPAFLLLLVIALLAISRTQSHGGFLALAGAGVAMLLIVFLRRLVGRGTSRRGLAVFAGIVLLLLIAAGVGLQASATGARLLSAKNRAEIYRDTLELVRDHPLTGVGPGLYASRFRAYQTVNLKNRYFHAHSDLLETAAEFGLPVALLFWGFLAWRGYAAARRFVFDRDPWRAGAGLGCAGAIGALAIHSLVDFNLQIPANLMFLAIVVGLAQSLETPGSTAELARPRAARTRAGGLAIRLLLVLLLVAASWRVLDRRLALELLAADPGLPGVEAAQEHDPLNPEIYFRRGVLRRDRPELADRAAALLAFERAVELDPYSSRYWWELAKTRELGGDLDAAGAAYQRAVDLNPHDASYRWRLANFRLRAGDREAFLDELARAIVGPKTPRRAALALLLKSGGSTHEIDRVWPRDANERLELLRWLAAMPSPSPTETPDPTRELGFLTELWTQALAGPEPPTVARGVFFVDLLVQRGLGEEARRAWLELTAASGIHDPAYRSAANLIWDGGFELEPTGAGLGWRLSGDPAALRLVDGEGVEGSRALELRPPPGRTVAARQLVVAPAPAGHELGLLVRAPGGKSPVLEVEVADVASRRRLGAAAILDFSERWIRHSLRIEVEQENRLIELRIRSTPDPDAGTAQASSVWIDSVVLETVPPKSQP